MDVLLEQAAFANEAFYLAFEAKDYSAMDSVWSAAQGVMCLHPGWPALVGREPVMQSWQAILSNPSQAQVSFYAPSFERLADTTVVVVCYEETQSAVMVATNVFVAEDERLRMVVHQAGYCDNPPVNESR
jgi:hypothetical protein